MYNVSEYSETFSTNQGSKKAYYCSFLFSEKIEKKTSRNFEEKKSVFFFLPSYMLRVNK